MIAPIEPCGSQVRALVGPLEIQQIHELFNARPRFVKESACGGELQQPFSTCSATTAASLLASPIIRSLTCFQASTLFTG
jgi:hypothetical protein